MKPSDKTLRRLGISFVAEQSGISEYLLRANSLKILLAPDPTARAVVVVQHVRVGSRHEGAGNTGYSHLLEHMLFKGTPTHNKAKGNSYDEFVKELGNICNATTWYDRTNYFAKIPSHALGGYLEHEADRLRNANITDEELATEMPVVVDEFDIGENDPDQVLDKLLTATAFTEHPYKVDTIGAKSEVLQVTAESLKERLYNVYYWPNNVALIIVGGFDVEEALGHVARCYSKIPVSPRPIPTPYTVEPKQFGERRFVINKAGDLPRVGMAFHVPEADHDDHYPLVALATILGGNKSSRLYRKLVDKGLAPEAWAQMQELHDPGLFKVGAKVAPGTTPQKIERIILREIERLQTKPISAKELASLKKLNRNGTVMGRANRMSWAMQLSEAEAAADWRWSANYDENFDKITVEDIRRVAQEYLHADNRVVGYFLPKEAPAAEGEQDNVGSEASTAAADAGTSAPVQPSEPVAAVATSSELATVQPVSEQTPSPSGSSSLSYANLVTTSVLPNGLTLLLMPTPTETAIGFSLKVDAGVSRAPQDKRAVAGLVAQMLSRGSAKFSKKRLNDLVSEMLVRFGFGAGTFSSSLSTHVAPADFDLFLDMVSDALRQPTFDAAELELLKKQVLAQLEEAASDPGERSYTALTQALYTPDSPYYKFDIATRKAQLAGITVDDLRAFQQSAYVPQGAVLALVGHFDVAEMQKRIESKFVGWSGAPTSVGRHLAAGKESARRININIDGKDNLTIAVGVASELSRKSPDYLAAVIANKALGGDTLTSRLGYEIREKRGLTYGVNSYFADETFGGAPWIVRMTCNGTKVELAIPLISQVVSRFLAEGISEKELAMEKSSLINSTALQLDAPVDVAGALAHYVYTGVGIAALDSFEQDVRALTVDAVNAAIRKYFRISSATTVVAGTLPEGTSAS